MILDFEYIILPIHQKDAYNSYPTKGLLWVCTTPLFTKGVLGCIQPLLSMERGLWMFTFHSPSEGVE